MSDIQRGTCKWFDSKKGFGFITAQDGTDLFVHQTEIKAEGFRNLSEGEDVEFQVQSGEDGRRKAVRVTGPGGVPVKGDSRRQSPPYAGGGGGRGGRSGYGGGGYGGGYGGGGYSAANYGGGAYGGAGNYGGGGRGDYGDGGRGNYGSYGGGGNYNYA